MIESFSSISSFVLENMKYEIWKILVTVLLYFLTLDKQTVMFVTLNSHSDKTAFRNPHMKYDLHIFRIETMIVIE